MSSQDPHLLRVWQLRSLPTESETVSLKRHQELMSTLVLLTEEPPVLPFCDTGQLSPQLGLTTLGPVKSGRGCLQVLTEELHSCAALSSQTALQTAARIVTGKKKVFNSRPSSFNSHDG